jgi:hypothetical protein
VLDLGTLRSGTLAFFARHGMDLAVIGAGRTEIQTALSGFEDASAYGGALLWDLPNYLAEADLVFLGQWLGARLLPGAPVYLALATRTPYASTPQSFEIVDEQHLKVAVDTGPPSSESLLNGPKLDRIWPYFEVERSFLLRNGTQEYVWRRT